MCLYISYRLRAQFAVEGSEINALHGSSSVEDATKEIQKFFPVENTMAVIKPSAMTEKGESKNSIMLYISLITMASIHVYITRNLSEQHLCLEKVKMSQINLLTMFHIQR